VLPGAVTSVRLITAGVGSHRDQELTLVLSLAEWTSVTDVSFGEFHPYWHTYRLSSSTRAHGDQLNGPALVFRHQATSTAVLLEGPHEASSRTWTIGLVGEDLTLKIGPDEQNGDPGFPRRTTLRSTPWIRLTNQFGDGSDVMRVLFENNAKGPGFTYNTWHMQEQQAYEQGSGYFTCLHRSQLDDEMDAAAKAGVETFVVDVGWFETTGDWEANVNVLGRTVEEMAERASAREMALGLWMNPMMAAQTSRAYAEFASSRMVTDGVGLDPVDVWGTPESIAMCLASPYFDHLVAVITRLARQGVKNLKFDALWPGSYTWDGQIVRLDCDSSEHWHGTDDDAPSVRRRRYSALFDDAVLRLMEHARRAGLSVDVDITEADRRPNFGVLKRGRYFLINNGPYFSTLGVPDSTKIDPNTVNAVFYPSVTHSRIQRQALSFEPFVPSEQIYGHVLVSPALNVAANALASIVAGVNGLWGQLSALPDDLLGQLAISAELARRWSGVPLVRHGGASPGRSPEVYSKSTGRETLLIMFTHQAVSVALRNVGMSNGGELVVSSPGVELEGDFLHLPTDSAAVLVQSRHEQPNA
jgi:alpha-galactosidase